MGPEGPFRQPSSSSPSTAKKGRPAEKKQVKQTSVFQRHGLLGADISRRSFSEDALAADPRVLMSLAMPMGPSEGGFGQFCSAVNPFSALESAIGSVVERALSPLIERRRDNHSTQQHPPGQDEPRDQGKRQGQPSRLHIPVDQPVIQETASDPDKQPDEPLFRHNSLSSSEGSCPSPRRAVPPDSAPGQEHERKPFPQLEAPLGQPISSFTDGSGMPISGDLASPRGRIQKERRPSGVVFLKRVANSTSPESSCQSSTSSLSPTDRQGSDGGSASLRNLQGQAPLHDVGPTAHAPAAIDELATSMQRVMVSGSRAEAADYPSLKVSSAEEEKEATPIFAPLATSNSALTGRAQGQPLSSTDGRRQPVDVDIPVSLGRPSSPPLSLQSSNGNSSEGRLDAFDLAQGVDPRVGALLSATWQQEQEPPMYTSTEEETEGRRTGREAARDSGSRRDRPRSSQGRRKGTGLGRREPPAVHGQKAKGSPVPVRSSLQSPEFGPMKEPTLVRVMYSSDGAVRGRGKKTPSAGGQLDFVSPRATPRDRNVHHDGYRTGGSGTVASPSPGAKSSPSPVVRDIWRQLARGASTASPGETRAASSDVSGAGAKGSGVVGSASGGGFGAGAVMRALGFQRQGLPKSEEGPKEPQGTFGRDDASQNGLPPGPEAAPDAAAKPQAEEDSSENMAVLRCPSSQGECVVFLVGTAHVSKESCEEVRKVVRMVKPDVVFLEICPDRVAMLLPQEELQVPSFSEMLQAWKERRANAFAVLYSWMLAKVADKVEVLPGAEFRAAYEEAAACGATVKLGDRPVQVTLRRTWALLPPWHKIKLIAMLLLQALWLPSKSELVNLVEELKSADVLSMATEELSKTFPTLAQTLIHERDLFMAAVLRHVAHRSSAVVAVVGKGHMKGIEENWENDKIDVKSLMVIPPERPILTPAVRKWLTITAVGASATAVFFIVRSWRPKS